MTMLLTDEDWVPSCLVINTETSTIIYYDDHEYLRLGSRMLVADISPTCIITK